LLAKARQYCVKVIETDAADTYEDRDFYQGSLADFIDEMEESGFRCAEFKDADLGKRIVVCSDGETFRLAFRVPC